MLLTSTKDYTADVMVVHPLCSSNISKLGSNLGDVNKIYESYDYVKLNKYRELALNSNLFFLPLIFTTWGGCNTYTNELLNQLVSRVCSRNGAPFAPTLNYWRQRLCVAILVNQANLMVKRYSRNVMAYNKSDVRDNGVSDPYIGLWQNRCAYFRRD